MKVIPGHEIVGTISAVGNAVEGFSVGDRCVVDPLVMVRLYFDFDYHRIVDLRSHTVRDLLLLP